jgi:glycerol dehydrogenase
MHGEKVAFGLHAQLALEGRPAAEVDAVLAFCEAVGLPVTLAQVGVDVSDAEVVAAVAARTVKPGETSHNEPFEVTAEAVADAMRAADARGRRFRERAPYS